MKNEKELVELKTVTLTHQEIMDIVKTKYPLDLYIKYRQDLNLEEKVIVPVNRYDLARNPELVLSRLKQYLGLSSQNSTILSERIIQPLINSFHNLLNAEEIEHYQIPPRKVFTKVKSETA